VTIPHRPTAPGARKSSILRGAALFAVSFLPAILGCDRPPDVGNEPAPEPVAGMPIDLELAEAGAQWYRYRGCLACHTLGGGRALGPDLEGVTRRREYAWYLGIVLRPDSMFREDPVARALLEEFRTPMPETGATPAQARAIFEYLRAHDERVLGGN
jgi:cytochrome c